jgi:two-component system response regulator YesN
MRKVLVIDDEKLIRLGVKAMIERKEKDFYDITLCSNGREALELVAKETFNIVVTDIRMPQMDGITFIQNLQGYKNKPAIIILTGYDDFNYALEALKCGAKDYLLKPVKREELYSSLDKIEEDIKNQEELHKKETLVNSYIEDFRSNELNYIFLKDDITKEEIEDIGERIKLSIFSENYYLGILLNASLSESMKGKKLKEEVDLILNNFLGKNYGEIISFLDYNNNLVLISKSKDIFDYLGDNLRKDNLFRYAIGLAAKNSGFSNIKSSYEQAKQSVKYRMFSYAFGSILVEYEAIKDKDRDYTVPLVQIEKLENMIGTERDKEIKKLLSEIFNEGEAKNYNIGYVEELNYIINRVILSNTKSNLLGKEDFLPGKFERFSSIYNFPNYKEYVSELESFILYINEYIKTMKDIYGDKSSIEKAIEYMNKNYYKNLDLAIVSNEVSLNYSYFSQLFKQHTGENFVGYLKRIRVEKAKELLKIDKYKIYEVANKVGYEDSKQFTKIFRSVTGISPIEFKNKL